jgi:hypothetical protein
MPLSQCEGGLRVNYHGINSFNGISDMIVVCTRAFCAFYAFYALGFISRAGSDTQVAKLFVGKGGLGLVVHFPS